MEVLPDELKLQILYHLSYEDLVTIAQTNSEFREVCRDESIWRHLYERDFPNWDKYENYPWKESYLSLHNMDQSIYQFAQQYLDDHLMIDPTYARIDKMISDLNRLIGDFVWDHSEYNTYTYVELCGLALKMAQIATGLNEQYVGADFGQLNNERLFDRTVDELTTFLNQLELLDLDELDDSDSSSDSSSDIDSDIAN
jgi:hypothetical protein